jgi:hypothetical protein
MKKVEILYNTLKVITYIVYVITFININIFVPNFLQYLPSIVTILISLILMARFNPFSKYTEFTKFDKRIIFDAACFMFISLILSKGYLIYISEIRNKFL